MQKTNKSIKKFNKADLIARVIGVVWAFLLTGIVTCFYYTAFGNDYLPNPEYILELAEKGNTVSIYGKMMDICTYGIDDSVNTEYREINGIGSYVRAISQYKMFKESGDEERAKYYYDQLSECKEKMGKLDYLADELNETFEVDF